MRILAAVVLLLTLAIPSETLSVKEAQHTPDVETVSGFLEICAADDKSADLTPTTDTMHRGMCVGWIIGFVDGVLTTEAAHSIPPRAALICLPEGNSYGQMIHVIKKYIADHPELEHVGTEALALLALKTAFPCKK
jgi:hypothetical protein